MLESLNRQPNYTCLETVERTRRRAPARRLELVDTLRMEVALVAGREMFAWPGAKNFENSDLRKMVPNGTIGNGNFALHARSIFGSSAAKFVYAGSSNIGGRMADRFDFKIPLSNSGYSLRVEDRSAVVAYHGSFWADSGTLDILRLEVDADDIPAFLQISSATNRMDYRRIRIGASDFLLPSDSELSLVDLHRNEHRNLIQLTACREYLGESVLSFADPEPVPKVQKPTEPSVEAELPAGLRVTLVLTTVLDSKKSMVGDVLEAKVLFAVKDKHNVLIPKGAIARGRITRLERIEGCVLTGFRFSDLDYGHMHANFLASLREVQMSPLELAWKGSEGGGTTPSPARTSIILDREQGSGSFCIRGSQVYLGLGFQTTWITLPKPARIQNIQEKH